MAYTYTTPALVQAELQSTTAFSGSTVPSLSDINAWIEEESAYVNNLAETVFSTTSISSEFIDFDGGNIIVLQKAPVVSVSRLQYNAKRLGDSSGTDWSDKTEDSSFVVLKDVGMIRTLPGWNPQTGYKRMAIDYVWGYTSVPRQVQKLTTQLVARRALETLIMKNLNERNDGGTVSVGSISIVEPANYGVTSFRQLNSNIDALKDEVVKNFKVERQMFHWIGY